MCTTSSESLKCLRQLEVGQRMQNLQILCRFNEVYSLDMSKLSSDWGHAMIFERIDVQLPDVRFRQDFF